MSTFKQSLVLYYFPFCPFCIRVLNYLKKNQIDIELRNTRESREVEEELIKVGGKSQVPCLLIDGQPLYESNDIINWFESNNQ